MRFSPPSVVVAMLVASVLNFAEAEPVRKIYAHYMGGTCPIWSEYSHKQLEEAASKLAEPQSFVDTMGGQWKDWWLAPQRKYVSDADSCRLDIARAKRAGIDGFVIDAWSGGGSAKKQLDVFFEVIEQDNLDFEMTICFDYDCHRPWIKDKEPWEKFADSAKELLAKHGKSKALARRDGKPLLFTYHMNHILGREGPSDWNVRKDMLEKAWADFRAVLPEPVYIHGCIDGMPGMESKGERRYAIAEWAAKHFEAVGGFIGIADDWRLDPEVSRVVKKNGAEWAQPIFPQYHNVGWWQIPSAGLDIMRNNWKAAIATDSTLIQFVTWNDYGEATTLSPTYATGYTPMRLNRYFVELWKTGKEPVITKDEIHVVFRRSVGTPDAYPFRSRNVGKYADILEIDTFLTAPAKVVVPGYGEYEAPAGYDYRQFTLKVGAVSAWLERDGKNIAAAKSEEMVADSRWREDLTIVCASSIYEEEWKRDFPNDAPLYFSENGDIDHDGIPNWAEMLYKGQYPFMDTAAEATAADIPSRVKKQYGLGFVWSAIYPTRMSKKTPWSDPQPIDGIFNPMLDENANGVWWWMIRKGGEWYPAEQGDFNHRNWGAHKNRSYWKGFDFAQDGKIKVFGSREGFEHAVVWEAPCNAEIDARVELSDGQIFEKKAVKVKKGSRLFYPQDFTGADGKGDYEIKSFTVSHR